MTTPTPPAVTPIAAPALATATPSAIRDELTDMVVRDLLGPAGGSDEELNQYEDHAYQRYLVGMLAPKDKEVDGGELDELATGEGDEGEEGAAGIRRARGQHLFSVVDGSELCRCRRSQGNRGRGGLGSIPQHQERHPAEEGRQPRQCLEAQPGHRPAQ